MIGLPKLCGGNSKKASDPQPPPKQKATVTLINGNGAVSKTIAEYLPVQYKETPPSVYPCMEKSRKIAETLQVVKSTEMMKTVERANFNSEEQMAPTDNVAMVEIEARDEALFTDDEDNVSIHLGSNDPKRSRSLLPDQEELNKRIKLDILTLHQYQDMYGKCESPFPVKKLNTGYNKTNVVPGLVWRKEHVQMGDIVETVWRRSIWITGKLTSFWDEHAHGNHKGKIIQFCSDGYREIVDNVNNEKRGGFIKLKEYVTIYRKSGLYLDFRDKPISAP
ncbi:hypothetical protein H1R20_g14064, partial [Candolleomyces eurysporus]